MSYIRSYFVIFELVIQIAILVGRVQSMQLVYIPQVRPIWRGMRWSELQVTAECKEDRYNTNLNLAPHVALHFHSGPLNNQMTVFVLYH